LTQVIKFPVLLLLSVEIQVCCSLDGFTSHSCYGSFENEVKIFLREESLGSAAGRTMNNQDSVQEPS